MTSGTKDPHRARTSITTTRLTSAERRQLKALSVIHEQSISDLVRQIIVPVVQRRLREELGHGPG